ncbi:hypothetical protein BLNAU_18324 [Blattamonas nauphoetae]|uniref:Uncharacterized protein n=1 Tax=Blattamonas nauphoetae TaxID=2049346 RepID=A0ABQ9X572_9EUKA|nr:hypothetical protein BLNAU_18324 [Blattamonas nauphoetae]
MSYDVLLDDNVRTAPSKSRTAPSPKSGLPLVITRTARSITLQSSGAVTSLFIKEGRLSQLMVLLHPQTRPFEGNEDFHDTLIHILTRSNKSGTHFQIRLYMDHILRHIIRSQFPSCFESVCEIIFHLFNIAIHHPPTLQFLPHSSVPQAFMLFLSENSEDAVVYTLVTKFSSFTCDANVGRGRVSQPRRDLMRMLRREGLEDGIEQKAMNDVHQHDANRIKIYSLRLCTRFGGNCTSDILMLKLGWNTFHYEHLL